MFSTPRMSMAGGEGRFLEGVGLRFAPEREEVPMAGPWRRQHARASSVPATTPLFSRVVTSASWNAHMGKQGVQSAVREAKKVYEDRRRVRKKQKRGSPTHAYARSTSLVSWVPS